MFDKIGKALLSPLEIILFGKDFGMLWKYGVCRVALVGLTVLLAVFLPLVYFAAITAVPIEPEAAAALEKLIPQHLLGLKDNQGYYYIFLNMILPMFFVLIPILSAALPASVFFLGEKEQGTALTLLSAPCSPRQFFKAKVVCATVNSWVITVVAFIFMAIFVSVSNMYFSVPFFVSPAWLVEIFLLAPALSAFTVLITYLFSGKYIYIVEGVMTCGYVAVPFILLFIGQFTGLYRIGALFMVLVSVCIVVADLLLYRLAVKKISADKLI